MLNPSTIVVHLHDTVETASLEREAIDDLLEQVHRTVAAPVDRDLDGLPG